MKKSAKKNRIIRDCTQCMNWIRCTAKTFIENHGLEGKIPVALAKAMKNGKFIYFCKFGCEKIHTMPKGTSKDCRQFDHYATEPK